MSSPAFRRRLSRGISSRRFLPRASAVAVLAGVAFGVAACGSSSSSTTSTTSTTPASGSSTTTGASGSSSTTTSQPSGSSALAALGSKLAAGQNATYLATYTVKSTQNGKTNDGTFMIGHDGKNTVFAGVFAQGSFEEIFKGSKSTICAKTAGHWMCFGGSLGATIGKSVSPLLDTFSPKSVLAKLEALSGGAYGTETSTETFAGQSVTCITFHSHVNKGTYTVCVTSQGIVAKAAGKDESGTYSLTLSRFSPSVPSTEFTPPAKPTVEP